ncbi:MAG: T9SS type A sorting domain-containing protein [Ginsengibacter sp.]
MRTLRIISCSPIFLLFTAFSFGQNWNALNPPLNIFNGTVFSTALDAQGNIYAAGDFTNAGNNRFVAKWNGTAWAELGSGSSPLNANNTILTLASDAAGHVYTAGGFVNSTGNTYVAMWNGTTWSELGSGATALNADGFIYSIITDKAGNLYAAGGFTNASGKNYVAKWNGTTWSELGNGANALNANDAIFAITADSAGNIYAGGYFTNSSGKEYVAKWNGTSWSATGTGANALNANDFITSLAADNNGNVYAGGDFRNAADQYYVAKWNGTTWNETGSGNNRLNANGSINTIVIKSPAEIYTAGYFTDGTGTSYVAKWNGTGWSQINGAQSYLGANDNIKTIVIDTNNNIYAGGKFTNKSGHNYIAKWDGLTWSEPGSPGNPFYSSQPIYKIVADSIGNVYVSGYFMDGSSTYYLEHWDGSGWSELRPSDTSGMGIAGGASNVRMAIDRSGNVYTSGYFSNVDTSYICILKWDGNQWSTLEDYPGSLDLAGNITDIQTDHNGYVYASGSFHDPVLGLCSLAKWDGLKWTRLPGSAADYIANFCVANDGNIYAYGAYNAGGYYIANYNTNTHFNWTEVGNPDSSRFVASGANIFISLATDSKSNLYVNGYLNNTAGKRYIGKWDGTNWSEFGVTDRLGYALTIDGSDNIYANGSIEYGADCTVKKWNGTSWVGLGSPLAPNEIAPYGDILANDANGNIYSNALSGAPGVGSFIVKFGTNGSQPPAISSFTPTSGSLGTKITIKGNHFTGTSSVSFGGMPASSFSVNNDSTIVATVANGSTGNVLVKTQLGTTSLPGFTYTCDSIKGPVPTILSIGDSVLVSTPANYYQWYFNNNLISNETSDSIQINKAGFYRIETSANKICWVSSLDYPAIIAINPLIDTLKMSIYPNPSSGQFTVDVRLPQTTTVMAYVAIYDVNGVQVLQTNKLIFFGNQIKIPVTINTAGTFFVKVYVNGDSRQKSVIIL